MRRVVWLSAISVGVVGTTLASIPQAVASPVFDALGVLPDGPLHSWATQISADGTTVVGTSGSTLYAWQPPWALAFRWTEGTGMQYIGPGIAWAVSGDGSFVVGEAQAGYGSTAFGWRGGSASFFTPPPYPLGTEPLFAAAYGISDDGGVVVGTGHKAAAWMSSEGARWGGGTVSLNPDYRSFRAVGRVGGEEIVVSSGYPMANGYGVVVIRNGVAQGIGTIGPRDDGVNYGSPSDVSANGKVVVGMSSSPRHTHEWHEAFRWSSKEGMVGLGDLPGGDFASQAKATSANGGVVVGRSVTRYMSGPRDIHSAFYWTPVAGMQNLKSLLEGGFKLNLSGWSHLNEATGVSDSGLVIAGWGTRTNGVEEAFRVKLQQQIYINWDDRISTGWDVKKNAATGTEYAISVPGTWPTLNFPAQLPNGMTPDQYKDEVVKQLDLTFHSCGVGIDILDSRRDAWRSAALEVKFGPRLLNQQGTGVLDIDGKAWDVGPLGGPVDRFNARWDGEVAIFLNLGDNLKSPAHVANIIAHEAGHGLGLRHVRGTREVMDYTYNQGDLEEFNDVVSQIVEPPTPSGTPWAETHNPYYHLKRYVLGEDPESTQPGTWDLGSITIQKFEITNINHAGNLHNVTPGAGVGAGDGELGCETWSNVAYFAEVDPQVDTLSFYSCADFPLSIFASSEAGDVWDIIFGTGDVENPVLSFENLASGPLDGLLFQYDAGLGAYHVVGSFSGTVAEEMTLWGQDPEPIPEPATAVLLALAGLAGVAWRLPGVARRRPTA